jgi:hypothetical protein
MKPKILVCVLTGLERTHWINPDLAMCLIQMGKDARFEVNYFPVRDARPVEHARNIAVDLAKQMNVDWLIQMDADNAPYGSPLDVIASAGDRRVIGLTSAVYAGPDSVALCPDQDGAREGDFIRVPYVGGACLMIQKDVWRVIPKGPYFRLILPESYGDSSISQHAAPVGEDVYFSRLVQKQGIAVYTHRTARAAHFRTFDLAKLFQVRR